MIEGGGGGKGRCCGWPNSYEENEGTRNIGSIYIYLYIIYIYIYVYHRYKILKHKKHKRAIVTLVLGMTDRR